MGKVLYVVPRNVREEFKSYVKRLSIEKQVELAFDLSIDLTKIVIHSNFKRKMPEVVISSALHDSKRLQEILIDLTVGVKSSKYSDYGLTIYNCMEIQLVHSICTLYQLSYYYGHFSMVFHSDMPFHLFSRTGILFISDYY